MYWCVRAAWIWVCRVNAKTSLSARLIIVDIDLGPGMLAFSPRCLWSSITLLIIVFAQMPCHSHLSPTWKNSISFVQIRFPFRSSYCSSLIRKHSQITNNHNPKSNIYLQGLRLLRNTAMAPPPLQKQYMSSGAKPKKEVGVPRPSSRYKLPPLHNICD